MDLFTPGHILLVLIGALLLFGPKRLPGISRSLGRGLRDFKEAMNDAEARAGAAEEPGAAPEAADPSGPAGVEEG
jgi:sec-independent protein translocase protein TatA